MQAVILAAGSGTRLRPLTNDKPKSMVDLSGKPMLEYILNSLPNIIDEIVIIVGYKGDAIKDHFKGEWEGKKIIYVNQEHPRGTAHALFTAEPFIKKDNRFLILPGDNISEFGAFNDGLDYNYVVFAFEHEHPENFGVIELNEDGITLKSIQEKPENPPTNLISTASMILSPSIFDTELVLNERLGECFIPDLLSQVLEKEPIHVIRQKYWIPVDRVEDIPRAEKELLGRVIAV